MPTRQKPKVKPTSRRIARPVTGPTPAMVARQHRRIRELALASPEERAAAIAESARLVANAPHAEDEIEFTTLLGSDDFAD